MLFLSHLEGWELCPPSDYQLSSGRVSRCCPSPVFTVSDKRIAATHPCLLRHKPATEVTSLFPSRSTPSAVKMMVESVWVPCRTVKWISVLRTGCGSGQEVDALAR